MIRTFFASLTLVLAIPALAVPALANPETTQSEAGKPAAEQGSFVHDGVNYVYTVTYKGNGRRIITGTADGARFRLVANANRVEGTVNSRPVAFAMSEVRAVTLRERLATR